MAWPETIIRVLKSYRIEFINYLPDAMGERLLKLAREDSDFDLLPPARAE